MIMRRTLWLGAALCNVETTAYLLSKRLNGYKRSGSCWIDSTSVFASSIQQQQENDVFIRSMVNLGYSKEQQLIIVAELEAAGLVCSTFDLGVSSAMLRSVTDCFRAFPEKVTFLLIQDFKISPLTAHQTRAALLYDQQSIHSNLEKPETNHNRDGATSRVPISVPTDDTMDKPLLYKQTIVNKQAQQRKQKTATLSRMDECYGLPSNYATLYPRLAQQLNDFLLFMTTPQVDSQDEDPLRHATASVYVRHAKQFLGWYISQSHRQQQEQTVNHTSDGGLVVTWSTAGTHNSSLDLYQIIPSKEKESATAIITFLLWLRQSRQISVSYEANLLRGLTKLLKFRFRKDSTTDPTYGGSKSFDDIPVIRELRKLHRDANKRQAGAPRSSSEERKWLAWPEYLAVVNKAKENAENLLKEYSQQEQKRGGDPKGDTQEQVEYTPRQRKIAVAFQQYLILAFFANVPDRQRTIRELEIGRSFVKDAKLNQWCIKHSPNDYKTGKKYGERPPLHLSASLTVAIDHFLERWRPCLQPSHHNYLFVQSRTGQPLTQDSVYQIVGRTCYQYTGQRTNPHLLRDMIVTHVRESKETSEQQLEALALFMGHSIQIQRASYDRRTLGEKVAPAVELLEFVNSGLQ
jgi:hypothetical protein